ncbi:MAG: helix-turn-helix domain-containing protein [Raoultibacter sp.]
MSAGSVFVRQVGRAVRARRKEEGLTQRQLAQAAHVSERFIVSLEQGVALGMQLDKLLQVLDVLRISLCLNTDRDNKVAATSLEATLCQEAQSAASAYDEAFQQATSAIKPTFDFHTLKEASAKGVKTL